MIKRIFDIIFSSCAILLLSPFFVLLAWRIHKEIGAPVFFTQLRPGLNGKAFKLIKFRTMSNALGLDGKPLPDEYRMTSFGKLLRATSLDELPEFWNVLIGDMSIVGPRPLLMEYLPLYNSEQSRRHQVRPGITGWAQVNGRNALSWWDKFKLDVWYVDHLSFLLDLKILFLTIRTVIKHDGIHADGRVTVDRFLGN
jgi:lipopolysaccharide/colanic/teichoic acid biosynthesis glycosyltransferase